MSCRKAWSLIAIVAAGGGRPVARSRIAGQLWPDMDEERARRALSTTLWRLGKLISRHDIREDGLLRSDALWISLAPGAGCDLRDFRMSLEAAEVGGGHECLERAVALHAADLLPEEDHSWTNLERESVRALLVSALDKLLAYYESARDHQNCLRIGQRLVAIEPYLEHAHRTLIWAYGGTGERAAAARQFGRCAKLLKSELGLEPMPETVAAYAQALGVGTSESTLLRLAPAPAPGARPVGAIARLREHLQGAQSALDELGRA